MKNTKKLPTKQLEKFSNIFTQLGLVLVLFIVHVTLEHQTEQKTVASCTLSDESLTIYIEPEQDVIFTKEPKVVPKIKTKTAPPFIVDEIVIDDNVIIESIIDNPIDEPTLIDINDIVEVTEDDTEYCDFGKDLNFISVQNAPVFKGCENLSKEENKRCFDKKMKQFVQRNFNVELANELGLHSGKHKIQTQFIIDKEGNVIDVKIRAPHKSLKKETQRIINKLPKFKPGKQNNKSVQVRYTLPIAFSVE